MGPSREPDIEALADHLRRADLLDPAELRELIPSVLILEGVAIRESPRFDADGIAALRATNRRLLESANEPKAAAHADGEFHRLLTAGCENEHLLQVLHLVHKALLEYERVYMLAPDRVEQSFGEHEAIVEALEDGDHELAAERVRDNFTSGLPATEALLRDRDREA